MRGWVGFYKRIVPLTPQPLSQMDPAKQKSGTSKSPDGRGMLKLSVCFPSPFRRGVRGEVKIKKGSLLAAFGIEIPAFAGMTKKYQNSFTTDSITSRPSSICAFVMLSDGRKRMLLSPQPSSITFFWNI